MVAFCKRQEMEKTRCFQFNYFYSFERYLRIHSETTALSASLHVRNNTTEWRCSPPPYAKDYQA
ncbi:UNVERIFIED_CONTAM: hypothetical protein FKN15_036419 [Acipenser sinensis]